VQFSYNYYKTCLCCKSKNKKAIDLNGKTMKNLSRQIIMYGIILNRRKEMATTPRAEFYASRSVHL
jgi:hypothetical protein